ncbi:MAG: MarR family winged helix-turn-helix transcriptional regulator [Armatimonadota bacterium]
MSDDARKLLDFYPKIYFACHTRHVRDPKTEAVLTSNQASILDHLDVDQPMNLNSLACHMGVTAATMSIGVDRLVGLGYISRERSERDRRQVLLLLTPSGKTLSEAHSVLDIERVQGMLDMMSPEQRERGLDGLELIAKAAEEYFAMRGPGWKDSEHEGNQEE